MDMDCRVNGGQHSNLAILKQILGSAGFYTAVGPTFAMQSCRHEKRHN